MCCRLQHSCESMCALVLSIHSDRFTRTVNHSMVGHETSAASRTYRLHLHSQSLANIYCYSDPDSSRPRPGSN